jgi:hypothetical protein
MRLKWISLLLATLPLVAHAGEVCLTDHPTVGNVTVQCALPGEEFDNAWVGFSEAGVPCQVGPCDFSTLFYEYSISASDTDPYLNSAALPEGVVNLHLWLVCAYDFMSNAGFSVEVSEDLTFLSYVTAPGVLNAGSGQDLLLAVLCGTDYPVRLGSILLYKQTPVGVEPEGWGGVKSLYR